MSRLEAVAAGLYYPTPEPVVSAIAQLLLFSPVPAIPPRLSSALPQPPVVRLLDPCAGKGRALALLAEALRRQLADRMADQMMETGVPGQQTPALELYGIEPNLERAREAQTRIPNLLASSFFTTTLSEGGFQLAFVNPPYDDVSAADSLAEGPANRPPDSASNASGSGRRERLELRFLRRVTSKLAPDGVLIWIVPQRLLAEGAPYLAAQYRNLACWRFPDTPWRAPDAPPDRPATPMYAAFGQVVLLARRRRVPVPVDAELVKQIETWRAVGADLAPLPDPSTQGIQRLQPALTAVTQTAWQAADGATSLPIPRYTLPVATTPLRHYLAATFDPDMLAAQLNRPGQGIWGERSYVERHWPDLETSDLGIGRPLAPLRRGHLALLAAAGIANGQKLVGTTGQRLVVKGACRKVSVHEEREERDPASGERIRVTTETERFEVSLWAIDLDTGEVIHVV
ncbi:MAG TPA: DUF6094 domain-containing protein [Ktedonobacterales bacterium]